MGIFDVPAGRLIEEIAADFKRQGIKQPNWVLFVKTGVSKERAPDNRDWFFCRMASILYRTMKDGPVGAGSLRTYYGSRKNRGCKKEHFYRASGKIIRVCLQLLEKQGLVEKQKKGRGITAKGQSYLAQKAKEVAVLVKGEAEKKSIAKAEKHKVAVAEAAVADSKRVEEELRKLDKKGGERGKDGKGKERHEKKEKQEASGAE